MNERQFSSITHLHLYASINTIIYNSTDIKTKKVVRLLDVGCGNGELMCTLKRHLELQYPTLSFEFFGLDVNDSLVQKSGFFYKTLDKLASAFPETNWHDKLILLKSNEIWPFADDYFDIIYSNQVMEHVFDQLFLLNQIKRTLTNEGWSIHLYPLRHYLYEGHLLIPFAHKFKSWTTTYHWIKFASYLGIGTYRYHKKNNICSTIHEYAERHADYMAYQVNYQTTFQITNTAKQCRLKPSFDFTYLYYKQKIRSLLKSKPIEVYRSTDMRSFKNSIYFFFLKYVSGITLVLRKTDTY